MIEFVECHRPLASTREVVEEGLLTTQGRRFDGEGGPESRQLVPLLRRAVRYASSVVRLNCGSTFVCTPCVVYERVSVCVCSAWVCKVCFVVSV